MNNEGVLEQFIIEELLVGNGRKHIDPDESLISSGIIDSLALMRLISFIEDRFEVRIDDGEVIPDNFETINIIKEFLASKKDN
jgi:D-alanine--poly(phosphoribitol) ligase subunit 2